MTHKDLCDLFNRHPILEEKYLTVPFYRDAFDDVVRRHPELNAEAILVKLIIQAFDTLK